MTNFNLGMTNFNFGNRMFPHRISLINGKTIAGSIITWNTAILHERIDVDFRKCAKYGYEIPIYSTIKLLFTL